MAFFLFFLQIDNPLHQNLVLVFFREAFAVKLPEEWRRSG